MSVQARRADAGDTISRNALFAFASQLGTAAFTGVLTIFLTRELGPAGFGTFALALSVTGLLLRSAGGGSTQAAARFVAERIGDTRSVIAVLGMALRYRALTASAVGLSLFVLAGPIGDLYNQPDLAGPVRGAALALVGQDLLAFERNVFLALRRATAGFKLVVSESAMELAFSVALVLAGTGATGAAFGRAAGYGFGAALGLLMLSRALGHSLIGRTGPSPVSRREFTGYAGAMFIVASASALFSQIDVLLLGAFLTTTAVGVYSAPLRLVAFLGYPGLAIAQGVAPRLARHPDEPPRVEALSRALAYATIVSALMIPFLVVWAEPIVELVLGPKYAGSASVLRAISPYVLLNGIGPLFFASLSYAGAGRQRIPISIATVVVAAALGLALIPTLGTVGAAISTDAAYALYVAGHAYVARGFLGLAIRPAAATALRSAAAAAVCAAVLAVFGVHELSAVEWIAGTIAGAGSYVLVLVATRGLSTADMRFLRRLPARALRGG